MVKEPPVPPSSVLGKKFTLMPNRSSPSSESMVSPLEITSAGYVPVDPSKKLVDNVSNPNNTFGTADPVREASAGTLVILNFVASLSGEKTNPFALLLYLTPICVPVAA